MRVRLNGSEFDLPDDAALADAVAAVTEAPSGIAVALDGTVVPRSQWSATPLVAPAASSSSRSASAGTSSSARMSSSRIRPAPRRWW